MCVIVVKPMGVKMPKREYIENCFDSNSDGAGFMFADGKNVRIRKGFMTLEAFDKAMDESIPEPMRTDTTIVMHFRIATHGKVQPSCCHPFPMSNDPEELKATSIDTTFGVAHNGIIQGRSTNDKWSDTMDFIAKVAYPLSKVNPNFMHNDYAMEVLEGACNSKLAIINGAGEVATVGDFVECDEVLYSNTSYLTWAYKWSTYKNVWSDEEYELAYGDLDYLVENLPYRACKNCSMDTECALDVPYCVSDNDAIDNSRYWNEEYFETKAVKALA